MNDNRTLQTILEYVENIDSNVKDLQDKYKKLDLKIDKNTERLDKIGLGVARLEDDTPTLEEFDNLEKRTKVLEDQIAKN